VMCADPREVDELPGRDPMRAGDWLA
jgi:hypothetical protein